MNKAIKALQNLKKKDKLYKEKVKLLAEIIGDKTTGHICPHNLVKWCEDVGLKTELNCDAKIIQNNFE